jgi:cytochrome b6-f complex iron-sulfur subunit
MQRRKLLNWLGFGAIGAWLNSTIAACTNSGNNSPAAVNPDGFVRGGTRQELKEKGKLLFKQGDTPILITADPTNPEKVYAVNAICPHKNCPVDWNTSKKTILCTCHGSSFKADGTLVSGPADRPLQSYPTKVEGDAIFVKV